MMLKHDSTEGQRQSQPAAPQLAAPRRALPADVLQAAARVMNARAPFNARARAEAPATPP
jgi:hypothetical protein